MSLALSSLTENAAPKALARRTEVLPYDAGYEKRAFGQALRP